MSSATTEPTTVDKSSRAIRDMFAGVAPRYDLLNRLLTGWLDVVWRRRTARALGLGDGARVLDLCSGTGDQALAVGRRGPRVAAADFCLPMVALSRRKFAAAAERGRTAPQPLVADAQRLPFAGGAFDGLTVSFGLRNVEDLDRSLAEIAAALRPGGRVAVLECALPRPAWLRRAFLFYFLRVLPWIGRLLSPRGSAYTYLPASVLSFPQRDDFTGRMRRAGLADAAWRDLAAGTVCLYTARRPAGTLPPPASAAGHPDNPSATLTRTPRMKIENGILDGKAVAAEIRAEVAAAVARMVAEGARPPGLTAVLVGDDPASKVYVGSKTRSCEEVGMVGRAEVLPATTSAEELRSVIDRLNADDSVDGILVQLPLPSGLPEREIVDRVHPDKDVDGFHPVNVGRLWLGEDGFVPATPSGIVEMLRRYEVPLSGRHAVVVGRSFIVGKPMAALLLAQNCTVTVAHSRTRDLAAVCREADLLVAAVGRAGLVGPDHVRDGAVVVDVGMNRLTERADVERMFPGDERRLEVLERRGGTLVGDVDFTRVREKASAITPVPGGVGPLTVAMLLANALTASRRRQNLADA